MTHLENVTNMYQLINNGKTMDAFEKYYHPNVIMEEVGEEPRNGKDANRDYEINFGKMIKEFHGAGVLAITANEDAHKTMVESWMDFTLRTNVRIKSQQVAVQTWAGDQIVHESFYHT